LLKRPSWEAWVERPVDLIKVGGRAQALKIGFARLPNGI